MPQSICLLYKRFSGLIIKWFPSKAIKLCLKLFLVSDFIPKVRGVWTWRTSVFVFELWRVVRLWEIGQLCKLYHNKIKQKRPPWSALEVPMLCGYHREGGLKEKNFLFDSGLPFPELLGNLCVVNVWVELHYFLPLYVWKHHESIHRSLYVIWRMFLCLKSTNTKFLYRSFEK